MLALTLLALASPCKGSAAETRHFPHADKRYLRDHQHDGGALLLPAGIAPDAPMPLVVFLHGTNSAGELHLWLGGGGNYDLRTLARRLMDDDEVQPFLLAGPSQTKGAGLARTLWSGFDLGEFVEDAARAARGAATIDHARVILVGHSGAGCNPTGGLAGRRTINGDYGPRALVSIDPCLDAELGVAFGRRAPSVPLTIWWQSAVWARSPEPFWAALQDQKPVSRIDRMTELSVAGSNPHDAIVPIAFERALRELLAPEPDASSDDGEAPD